MCERLIDLIDDALSAWESYRSMCFKIGEDPNVGFEEFVADYLLQDGVIAPPCNIEQSIYRCGPGKVYEWQIEHIEIYAEGIVFVDDSDNYFSADEIGKTVFLTKEEAEQALKRGMTDV